MFMFSTFSFSSYDTEPVRRAATPTTTAVAEHLKNRNKNRNKNRKTEEKKNQKKMKMASTLLLCTSSSVEYKPYINLNPQALFL